MPNASPIGARYREHARGGGDLFVLEPTQSAIRIFAFRGGKAARFGHNHVLSAPAFEGYFHLSPDGVAASRFSLEFRLDRLDIDAPALRRDTGDSFVAPLSAESIDGTRDNLLGATYMNAAEFPWVRLESMEISGESPKFAVRVAVEMRGQTREVWVPMTVRGLPAQLQAEGALVLRQTDFGIQPLSILGGLLTVQDALVLEFNLTGVRQTSALAQ